MFPLQKSVRVMVCVLVMISGAVTAENCVKPGQPLAIEQPAQEPPPAPPARHKKAKTNAEPLFPPAKALRKFAAKIKEAL